MHRNLSDTLIVTLTILLATSSYPALAGGKSGGSGGSKPAGQATSADKASVKLYQNAVKGKHIDKVTLESRKTGSGKVKHSDMNIQKTNDKASPLGLKDSTSIKGESMDKGPADPIR